MTASNKRVGIDAMGFNGAQCYIDMVDLATARDVDPAKFTVGIGQKQMSVATPCEDTVSMAALAGRKALEAFDIDPSEIGTLIIGTETGIDHSKPASVYVHELLGLPSNCRQFETKHACYGATAGLTSAADWILSGRARGRKALIIASDIARYGIGTPGEPTQGAGAVAMVVSENPRLFELDMTCIGDYSTQVMDFWRPLYSKYAFADGHYSIDCYLEALTHSIADAQSVSDDHSRFSPGNLAACFYHVPFVKMARKAHTCFMEQHMSRTLDLKDATDKQIFTESYGEQVAPWLSVNAQVGNIYTGSLFLSMIDFISQNNPELENREISLFSYGSGCGSSYILGRVVEGAMNYAEAINPREDLDKRVKLTIEEYEHIIALAEEIDMNEGLAPDPARWNLKGDIFYLGTNNHSRQYGPRSRRGKLQRAG
ncbi:MAG: hydroxymethylglutaryl-CoA synthase family protein [Gammaproteobacteria bacterium]